MTDTSRIEERSSARPDAAELASLINFARRALSRFKEPYLSALAELDTEAFVLDCLRKSEHARHPLLRTMAEAGPLVEDHFLTPQMKSSGVDRKKLSPNERRLARISRKAAQRAKSGSTGSKEDSIHRTDSVMYSSMLHRYFLARAKTTFPRRRVIWGIIQAVEEMLPDGSERRASIRSRMNYLCNEAFSHFGNSHPSTKSAKVYIDDALQRARLYERKWRRPDKVTLAAFMVGIVQSSINNDLRSRLNIDHKKKRESTGEPASKAEFREVELTDNMSDRLADALIVEEERKKERYQEVRDRLVGFVGDKPDLVKVIMCLERSSLRQGADDKGQWNHKELAELTGLPVTRIRKMIELLETKIEQFRATVKGEV